MTLRTGAGLLIGCLGGLGVAMPLAAAQQQGPEAGSLVIEGPPAPTPPEVVARDARGRVTVRAVRIQEPPSIDGVLDDEHYTRIPAISDFVQQEPHEGQPATEQTEVWVLFDRENLYIAARCRDSQPDRIVANEMRRDGMNLGQNDHFGVILDTFYDRRNGFQFQTNAVGGMGDSYVTDERDINRDWNTVWLSKSRRDDQGWTLEMAIPFRSLRYAGGASPLWGINFRRAVRWKNEFSYLSPVPRAFGLRGFSKVSSAGTLVGIEPPSAAVNVEVKPYAVSSVKADRQVDPGFRNDLDRNAGFDLKYGLTRSLTADFTYRTDFAQVEDDDQQVNLTRFSLFFPEKREFFLEGQGIFAFGGVEGGARFGPTGGAAGNTPLLFFSRQIGLSGGRPVPIQAGGRITGKAGRYSVGLLEIQSGDSTAVGAPATNFAVVRLKRDVLRRSYIGVIATRRSPSATADGTNLAFGADASFAFYENLNVLGYYARTQTPGLSGNEDSYRARFDLDGDLFGIQVERLAVGRNFKPEIGFLRRTDFIQNLAEVRVSRRPRAFLAIRKTDFELGLDYITDGRERLENRQLQATWRTEMRTGDFWSIGYVREFEFLPESLPLPRSVVVPVGAYHFSGMRGSYFLGPQRRITGGISFARGEFYDGDRTDVGYRGRVELTPKISIEPGISVNRIELPQGSFTATLLSARTSLTFTPSMLLAAFVQYNSTATLITTNVRFRWEYRPGSDLFIVYSDGRDTLQREGPRLLNRGLTLKLTRLFRL